MARPTGRPLRHELIEAATRQIQVVGVNSFSYRDLAAELGVTAPSIHHHFPTKVDLVAAVAARYREWFAEQMSDLPDGTVSDRITAYAGLFAHAAASDRLCLCGSLSADWLTVSDRARTEACAPTSTSPTSWPPSSLRSKARC